MKKFLIIGIIVVAIAITIYFVLNRVPKITFVSHQNLDQSITFLWKGRQYTLVSQNLKGADSLQSDGFTIILASATNQQAVFQITKGNTLVSTQILTY
jgi:hypothetical protein